MKIEPSERRSIIYQFKWGKSMGKIAESFNLELSTIEQIIREYLIANTRSVVR
jgi:DNA-binding NarL/FixJ family response regulator